MDLQTQRLIQGAAGAGGDKVYVDDLFSTFLYKGNGSVRSINNGLDLSGEGGLTWIKNRDNAAGHMIFDTVRGAGKYIKTNSTSAEANDAGRLSAFNNNGFSLGTEAAVNDSSYQWSSWSFRKAPGFFTIKEYSGTGSAQTLTHDLGSVPGCIMIKRLDAATYDWAVYHSALTAGDYLKLNDVGAAASGNNRFDQGAPTATNFAIGTSSDVNASGGEYIAYIFAGGESTAATARSVVFDGNDELTIASSSDFDLGNTFTWEFWIRQDEANANWRIPFRRDGGDYYYIQVDQNGKLQWTTDDNKNCDSANGAVQRGQWTHCAFVANSGTGQWYVNGIASGAPHTGITGDGYSGNLIIGGWGDNSSYYINAALSNVRIVKGTAVYTTAFRPPTEPLTNISGTVLLCCNNSSVTGATVTPNTITATWGTPTASTDSPFDGPAAFTFGDAGDQNVIKCGGWTGNGSTTGPVIDLGWEPQWILIRNTDLTHEPWMILDSMRGIPTGGNVVYQEVNRNVVEDTGGTFLNLTPTGFKLTHGDDKFNGDGHTYIYMAIRRSDPLVQKPQLATDVFAMAYGNSGGTNPSFVSNFPVDFAFTRQPATSEAWYTAARLIQGKYLHLNDTDAEASASNYLFDHNNGWRDGSAITSYLSWNFKRHAGFDVVAWKSGGGAETHMHGLAKAPEMIWIKNRNSTTNWRAGHKGLNGGTNPWTYGITLSSDSGEFQEVGTFWDGVVPGATSFRTGSSSNVGGTSGDEYIAMLFASVDGISKVGSYSGSDSTKNITDVGFQPRFLILKNITTGGEGYNWYVFDTTRGWGSGADKALMLDDNAAQLTSTDYGAPTSTGFDLVGNKGGTNDAGQTYIYYAHA